MTWQGAIRSRALDGKGISRQEFRGRSDDPLQYLSQAADYHKQALDMLPANAQRDLAQTHNLLGLIYDEAGQTDGAIGHFRESIRLQEAMQERFGAWPARHNTAVALARSGRFSDARDWARSAFRDVEACENADREVIKTLQLLEEIESRLRATSPPS